MSRDEPADALPRAFPSAGTRTMTPGMMDDLCAALARAASGTDPAALPAAASAIEDRFRAALAAAPHDVRDTVAGHDPSHSLASAFLLGQLAMARAFAGAALRPDGAPEPANAAPAPGMGWTLSDDTRREIAEIGRNAAMARRGLLPAG